MANNHDQIIDAEVNRHVKNNAATKISATTKFRAHFTLKHTNKQKKQRVDKISQTETSNVPREETEESFHLINLVKTTKTHNIYCVHTSDGARALKTSVADNPRIEHAQNLDNELKVGYQISHHTVRKSYSATTYQGKKALLLEWVDGIPLSHVTKLAIPDFFKIAREIILSLLSMHSNGICHLNLTSDHIIFNSESNSTKIIGCGSSSSVCSKVRSHNPKLLERDLRYVSPEQTGRVNRRVDYRSDFYSLGVIFYRLLTGNYPFESQNALNIIKMHVHQEPSTLHEIDANIPLPISDMTSKLMEKNVDLRYQSATGIMYDIDLIISEYKSGFQVTLAQHDSSNLLLLPQKLYGRENEYNTLIGVFDRILSSSSFELVLVKAKSGVSENFMFHTYIFTDLQKFF